MVGISDLPPELVRNVTAFVRQTPDLRAMCLVNRTLHACAAPDLWEWFETSLMKTTQQFDALTHHRSNIVAHVREFTLLEDGSNDDAWGSDNRPQLLRLLTFLTALPRDTLRYLHSDVPIDGVTLQIALQSQRSLNDFRLPLHQIPVESLPPYLNNVASIRVDVSSDPTQTAAWFEPYKTMLCKLPLINSLDLRGTAALHSKLAHIGNISLAGQLSGPTRLALQTLSMSEIELGLSYSNLFNYIDSLSLTELRLVECLQIQPLLTHLIQSFNSNGSNLKRLDIVESSRTVVPHVPVSPTISTLLSSFKGLRHLAVATRGSTQVSKESIINHAETLERLQIDNSSNSLRPAAYGESDLAAILTACSNLEELAIEMGIPVMEDWLGIHHDIFQEQSNDLTGEDEASPCSALLPMIASHSRLHTLRMLDHPFIDWDHDGNSTRFLTDPIHGTRRELAAIIVKGVATQVFCHLSKKGSRIQTLAWCPGYYTNIRPTLDSNGHAWLGYMYRKQTTFDLQGKQYVDAAPLRKWWEEIAEDSIFEFVHWISD